MGDLPDGIYKIKSLQFDDYAENWPDNDPGIGIGNYFPTSKRSMWRITRTSSSDNTYTIRSADDSSTMTFIDRPVKPALRTDKSNVGTTWKIVSYGTYVKLYPDGAPFRSLRVDTFRYYQYNYLCLLPNNNSSQSQRWELQRVDEFGNPWTDPMAEPDAVGPAMNSTPRSQPVSGSGVNGSNPRPRTEKTRLTSQTPTPTASTPNMAGVPPPPTLSPTMEDFPDGIYKIKSLQLDDYAENWPDNDPGIGIGSYFPRSKRNLWRVTRTSSSDNTYTIRSVDDSSTMTFINRPVKPALLTDSSNVDTTWKIVSYGTYVKFHPDGAQFRSLRVDTFYYYRYNYLCLLPNNDRSQSQRWEFQRVDESGNPWTTPMAAPNTASPAMNSTPRSQTVSGSGVSGSNPPRRNGDTRPTSQTRTPNISTPNMAGNPPPPTLLPTMEDIPDGIYKIKSLQFDEYAENWPDKDPGIGIGNYFPRSKRNMWRITRTSSSDNTYTIRSADDSSTMTFVDRAVKPALLTNTSNVGTTWKIANYGTYVKFYPDGARFRSLRVDMFYYSRYNYLCLLPNNDSSQSQRWDFQRVDEFGTPWTAPMAAPNTASPATNSTPRSQPVSMSGVSDSNPPPSTRNTRTTPQTTPPNTSMPTRAGNPPPTLWRTFWGRFGY